MVKPSRVMIFGDHSWPAESLGKFYSDDSDRPVSVWIDGRGWVRNKSLVSKNKFNADTAIEAAENLKPQAEDSDQVLEDVAIIGFEDQELAQKVVEALRAKRSDIKILQVGSRGSRTAMNQTKRSISWKDLISSGVDQEMQLLNLQSQVKDLRAFAKDAEKVAILLQEDPDPDGLAAALALRKVLGRKSQTAPIVSFGIITRPENVAMAKLLGIEVNQVEDQDLKNYDKVVLLDCQPSFFKGRKFKVDAIIDHHPAAPLPEHIAPDAFIQMREDLGSISTLMSMYLRAADISLSQRLATALLYGIKSDTLMLNREVSDLDLAAFVHLYPLANGNTLRKIERPELPIAYLDSLRKGLKYLKTDREVTVVPLVKIEREEWIPQAADFALQVEGSLWAMGVGIFDKKVIISGRNCGYVNHCGEFFKKLFDEMGCAGGHKTMAKAIIPKAVWEKYFGVGSTVASKIGTQVHKMIVEEIDAREKDRDKDREKEADTAL